MFLRCLFFVMAFSAPMFAVADYKHFISESPNSNSSDACPNEWYNTSPFHVSNVSNTPSFYFNTSIKLIRSSDLVASFSFKHHQFDLSSTIDSQLEQYRFVDIMSNDLTYTLSSIHTGYTVAVKPINVAGLRRFACVYIDYTDITGHSQYSNALGALWLKPDVTSFRFIGLVSSVNDKPHVINISSSQNISAIINFSITNQ